MPDFFWKMPDVFSKRLKLDQLEKSGTFSKMSDFFKKMPDFFDLKVHKREKCFGSDFEFFTILQLIKLKY